MDVKEHDNLVGWVLFAVMFIAIGGMWVTEVFRVEHETRLDPRTAATAEYILDRMATRIALPSPTPTLPRPSVYTVGTRLTFWGHTYGVVSNANGEVRLQALSSTLEFGVAESSLAQWQREGNVIIIYQPN